MTGPGPASGFEPLFLEGSAGPVFAVYYPARPVRAPRPGVVYLPPFAEELNRSRRMAALQARALAQAGVAVLVVDPYGCGDSFGSFGDARWDIWCDDAARAARWMRARGHEDMSLIGLRLGALLALEVSGQISGPAARAVLWQPVLRGDLMITQFLRLKLAAELAGRDGGGANTAELRRRLGAGEIVEIAGYPLGGALAAAIDKLSLEALGRASPARIDWIEIVGSADQAMTPAQQQIATRWQSGGVRFATHRLVAEPFWTLQETTFAPEMITLTTDLIAKGAA